MNDFVVQHRFEGGSALSELAARWEELALPNGSAAHCVMVAGALDGRRAIGLYRASDEEALRSRLSDLGLSDLGIGHASIWPASPVREVTADAVAGLPSVLIEREIDPPVTKEMVIATFLKEQSCYDLRGAVWRQSYLSDDGRRMICWFDAPDAEAIRSAVHTAGHLPGTVWSAAWVKEAPSGHETSPDA